MKTKKMKKLALTFASAAFVVCGATGIAMANFSAVATDSIGSFEMVEGASVRTVSGTTGIRFTAKFDETLYNVVKDDDDKEFGMLITKLDYYTQATEAGGDLIAALDDLGSNKYILVSESSANPCTPYVHTENDATEYRVSGALTNIQYSHMDWQYIGVGVVITGNGDAADTYEYAKTDASNARSIAYVASAALNDEAYGYKDYEKEVMRNYVYEYAAKVDGVEETAFDAQEDRSTYLDGATATIGDGVDTSEKYNENVAGKETYLAIDEKATVNITAKTAAGNALDIACETTTANDEVVKVENANDVTALANGYATLTVSSAILGDWTESLTAYVGSESVVKLTETSIYGWSGAQTNYHSSSETGTIKGVNYYGYTGRGAGSETVQFWAYSDTLSVYYIDHMIEQGYTHVRMPFYFDTSLSHELYEGVSEADKATAQKIRAQVAPDVASNSFVDTTVDLDEWIYWDIDINHYRAHFAEAENAAVDTYGLKTGITDKWYYVNALFMNMKNTLVYLGEQTFIKDGTYTVNEESATATFGETVTLSDKFTANVALAYEVDGAAADSLTAVYESQTITVNGNIYTHTLSDWQITVTKSAAVTKDLTVSGGVKKVNLVDVNGMEETETVAFADYTKTTNLENLGWTVDSVTYEKRYAAADHEQAATIASTERGIFYANVTASKDDQTVDIAITLDLYDSTEAVEYESFAHADSSYAVKVYYYVSDSDYKKVSYDSIKSTYTAEAGTGLEMTVGDAYLSLNKYGDLSSDTGSNVSNAYGHTDIHYLAIDQSSISTSAPLTATTGDNVANINVYVTPRHTKEYYAMYAEDSTYSSEKLKYAYAAGSSSTAQPTNVSGITGVGPTYTQHGPYSAEWKYSTIPGKQTITLSAIVDNYDSFASMSFPMFISEDPQGRHADNPANGYAKLGALLF